jgi:RNA polymerase sigma-32 factor
LPRTTKPHERTKKKSRAEKPPASSRPGDADTTDPTDESTGEGEGEGGEHDDGADGEDREDDGHEGDRHGGDGHEADRRGSGDADDPDPESETFGEVVDDGDVPVLRGKAAGTASERSSIERFDPLSAYLREVQRHPLLSPEETQKLAEQFVSTQDPTAAARLVTSNLRLVVKIAYEYRRAYKNIMDLIQEGNIGLMQAVKRYDPYRGVKLSSYGAWWIRAYILRFILNNWRLVKLGTTQAQRKLFFNLRKKRAELQALGIDPTNAEIAKQLNVPESEVAEMDVRLQASEKSLDAPMGDGEGRATAKVDTMPSQVEGPEALMADSELQGLLKEKLGDFRKTLVGKEKDLAIFDERLVADEPLTLQELGDRFGISRERVRQLEQRLTGRLREYLRDEMGDAVDVA